METKGKCIEEKIGDLLKNRKWTLAVAESCTGGLIAHRTTAIPGASAYFERGIVSYSNRAKVELLGVPQEVLDEHGAVSRQTAKAMCEGVSRNSGTEVGLSTTGIAGPGGGSPGKPVGTVYIGLHAPEKTLVQHFTFSGDRRTVKNKTADEAFDMLHDYLLSLESQREKRT